MEQDVFLEIIEQHKRMLFQVASSYTKTDDERQDLLQDIIGQLWIAFPKFNHQNKWSTWIYRIALNVSISHLRKSSKIRLQNNEWSDKILEIQAEIPQEENENVILLHRFISELKEIDRALMLLFLDEKSHQEISDILGITTSNVATKLARIKKLIKSKFDNLNQQK